MHYNYLYSVKRPSLKVERTNLKSTYNSWPLKAFDGKATTEKKKLKQQRAKAQARAKEILKQKGRRS